MSLNGLTDLLNKDLYPYVKIVRSTEEFSYFQNDFLKKEVKEEVTMIKPDLDYKMFTDILKSKGKNSPLNWISIIGKVKVGDLILIKGEFNTINHAVIMSSRLDLSHGYCESADLHTVYVFETDTFIESSLIDMIAYLSSFDVMKILKEKKKKVETDDIVKIFTSDKRYNFRNNRRSRRR
jgi:hypothetical protein